LSYQIFKRIMDFVISLFALIIASPVLLIIAILVRATSKGPAIFKQVRSGKDLKEFEIYKFRTMYTSAPKDTPTHLLDGAQSFITPVARSSERPALTSCPSW